MLLIICNTIVVVFEKFRYCFYKIVRNFLACSGFIQKGFFELNNDTFIRISFKLVLEIMKLSFKWILNWNVFTLLNK